MTVWENAYKVLAVFRRRKVWLSLFAVFGVWMVFSKVRGPEVTTSTVKKSLLTQKVVMTGRVRSPSRIQMGALQPGVVSQVLVAEGEQVKSGQLLLQLNDTEAQATVDAAKAALEQARARYSQFNSVTSRLASEALKQAQLAQDNARKKKERAQALSQSGGLTQAEWEAAENELSVADSRVSQAQAQALASSSAGSDARWANAAVLQADAQLRIAQARLEQLRLVAPCDGVVLKRLSEPGDVATLGKVLLVLAKDNGVQLTAEPDERNLALLAPNQKAKVSADAFPSITFPAKVSWVAPAVDPDRGTVEVRLDVLERPDFLRPDMTVSIEVEVNVTQTTVVPTEAIVNAATAKPSVWVVDSGKVKRVPVSLGIFGEGAAEVKNGLTEGALVVTPYVAGLKEGQRVRAAPSEAL